MKPEDIEKQSFAIIEKELSPRTFPPGIGDIVKRVIHTTADFSFADSLCFSDGAVEAGVAAMKAGCTIVTDTQMATAGFNSAALARLSCRGVCYMANPAVAAEAKRRQCTRAAVSMEKARTLSGPVLYALGNAPTALLTLCEEIEAGLSPALVVGVPVGFVNAAESKERLTALPVPYIVARGRKGGSSVAAAICNALLYLAGGRG